MKNKTLSQLKVLFSHKLNQCKYYKTIYKIRLNSKNKIYTKFVIFESFVTIVQKYKIQLNIPDGYQEIVYKISLNDCEIVKHYCKMNSTLLCISHPFT
jgi:hypothetical protein